MSDFANPASTAIEDAPAYTALLIDSLGDRNPLDVMREMPEAIEKAVTGLSPEALSTAERSGKWSIAQVIQHLADSDMIGGVRFRMVLAHERPPILGYDQDLWSERLRYSDADATAALADFTAIRKANVRVLERITEEDHERVGIHSERGEESVARMPQLYAGHDMVHLAQITRIRKAVAG